MVEGKYVEDECPNCPFSDVIGAEIRFCPECGVELKGWAKRSSCLKFKTVPSPFMADWECKDC